MDNCNQRGGLQAGVAFVAAVALTGLAGLQSVDFVLHNTENKTTARMQSTVKLSLR